jgi:hypothetical protein
MAENLKSPYLVWQGVASPQAYAVRRWDDALGKNPGGAPLYLSSDEPLAARWPKKVMCLVDHEHRQNQPVLQDFLVNAEQWLVVSGRLKTFLENANVPDVEYLPVQVIDPTGLPLDENYVIVHLLNSPDCLDMQASGAKLSRVVPNKAERILRIALKNDPGRPLFRPSTFGKLTLVSWALAEAIADHGFSGFRFMGFFDYEWIGDLRPHPKRAPIDALCKRLWTNAQRKAP